MRYYTADVLHAECDDIYKVVKYVNLGVEKKEKGSPTGLEIGLIDSMEVTDRQTDRHADRQTDIQSDASC